MPSRRRELKGVLVLIPLPMKKGELDMAGMRENIESLENTGVSGVIALGSMGEFFQISADEFDNVVDCVVDSTRGKMTSVIGTSYQNLNECLRRTKYADDAGADGAMVMPPYYLNVTPKEAILHYQALDREIKNIRIMAYNFPPASKINLSVEMWSELLKLDSITAVKESNSDMFHLTRVLGKIGSKVNVLAGSESWLLLASLLGANGVTSNIGIGFPELVAEYFDACKTRKLERAVQLHKLFVEATWFISSYNEAAWLKAFAELCGKKAGEPRLPYLPLDGENYKRLESWVSKVKSITLKAP